MSTTGIGWKDPYAQARFSTRQRDAGRRNQARGVYAPQLLLDGADYRRGVFGDDLERRIAKTPAPGAQISMTIDASNTQSRLRARINAAAETAQAYAAIYENNLVTEVAAGENRGKRLHHDFVVRELYGPFTVTSAAPLNLDQVMRRDRQWKMTDLHIAVFVQTAAVPLCRRWICRGVLRGNQGALKTTAYQCPPDDDSAILPIVQLKGRHRA